MMLDLDIMQAATLADVAMCVNHYRMSTLGLFVCVHAQVRLGDAVFVPGLVAQVNQGKFKQCDPGDYDYFSGPPNFVFDVCHEEQRPEIERRRRAFEASGVIEYVLWNATENQPVWLRLVEGKLIEVPMNDGDIIESAALPGMRFPVTAFKARDWWSIMAATSYGITRQQHHDFMATIWKK
ncbi:Uma2 family endonuclease [Roseimicrobium gellanilyticum]|nr:Uma2 family endonuclease [Roseimicrobium gellanilyticum]